jgi:hypothetical protein
MKTIRFFAGTLLALLFFTSCSSEQEKMEKKLREFIASYEAKITPLYREMNITSWNANITGTDADFALSEKASFDFNKIFCQA